MKVMMKQVLQGQPGIAALVVCTVPAAIIVAPVEQLPDGIHDHSLRCRIYPTGSSDQRILVDRDTVRQIKTFAYFCRPESLIRHQHHRKIGSPPILFYQALNLWHIKSAARTIGVEKMKE